MERSVRERFWERFSLGELNGKEWEALCDGCGKCCLKRESDGTHVTVYGVACRLLDLATSRCTDYAHRLDKMPYCRALTAATIAEYSWLPESCAYRRLNSGKQLPKWHPLLVGDDAKMRKLGIKVGDYALSRNEVPKRRMQRHIIAKQRL